MLALSVSHLNKVYANGVSALDDVSIDVEQGEFLALLGPNGAGKSTLISIINSLVLKSSGSVEVYGHNLDRDMDKLKSCIGVVPQEFNFSIFETVEQIIQNQAGYYGLPYRLAKSRAHKYIKKLNLWDKRNTISRALSGGMKRRLMIARALVHEPKVLILDEPTAGVDIEIRRDMWEFLQELNQLGTTIILTTHYLEEAEQLCDRIAIINHGKIISDQNKKTLLSQLDHDAYLADVELHEPITTLASQDGLDLSLIDGSLCQIVLSKNKTINDAIGLLQEQGVTIKSLRNKANRLEEMFVHLTAGNEK